MAPIGSALVTRSVVQELSYVTAFGARKVHRGGMRPNRIGGTGERNLQGWFEELCVFSCAYIIRYLRLFFPPIVGPLCKIGRILRFLVGFDLADVGNSFNIFVEGYKPLMTALSEWFCLEFTEDVLRTVLP